MTSHRKIAFKIAGVEFDEDSGFPSMITESIDMGDMKLDLNIMRRSDSTWGSCEFTVTGTTSNFGGRNLIEISDAIQDRGDEIDEVVSGEWGMIFPRGEMADVVSQICHMIVDGPQTESPISYRFNVQFE